MKVDPAKPISALIAEMNKLFDRVAYYGEPASDRVKGAALKAALPKKFDVLKTALAPWKNLSYKQICEELISHDTTNKTTYKSIPTATGPVTHVPSKAMSLMNAKPHANDPDTVVTWAKIAVLSYKTERLQTRPKSLRSDAAA